MSACALVSSWCPRLPGTQYTLNNRNGKRSMCLLCIGSKAVVLRHLKVHSVLDERGACLINRDPGRQSDLFRVTAVNKWCHQEST